MTHPLSRPLIYLASSERADDERIAGLPVGALSPDALEFIDDLDPTDDEIIELVMEAFGMGRAETLERLERIDFEAAREVAA